MGNWQNMKINLHERKSLDFNTMSLRRHFDIVKNLDCLLAISIAGATPRTGTWEKDIFWDDTFWPVGL